MMILTTFATNLSDDKFRVYWKTKSFELGGYVDVKVHSKGVKTKVIAELEAIRFLLVERNIFDRVIDGKGIKLQVSNNLIQKISDINGEEYPETKFGNILFTRMFEAECVVSKESDWVEEGRLSLDENIATDSIEITNPKIDVIKTRSMGNIVITKKAIIQFISSCEKELDHPLKAVWKGLYKRLQVETLRPDDLPEIVIQKKKEKWGVESVIYGSGTDVFHYVTVEGDPDLYPEPYSILVNVYVRRKMNKPKPNTK